MKFEEHVQNIVKDSYAIFDRKIDAISELLDNQVKKRWDKVNLYPHNVPINFTLLHFSDTMLTDKETDVLEHAYFILSKDRYIEIRRSNIHLLLLVNYGYEFNLPTVLENALKLLCANILYHKYRKLIVFSVLSNDEYDIILNSLRKNSLMKKFPDFRDFIDKHLLDFSKKELDKKESESWARESIRYYANLEYILDKNTNSSTNTYIKKCEEYMTLKEDINL